MQRSCTLRCIVSKCVVYAKKQDTPWGVLFFWERGAGDGLSVIHNSLFSVALWGKSSYNSSNYHKEGEKWRY
jgi:hypothetical protein